MSGNPAPRRSHTWNLGLLLAISGSVIVFLWLGGQFGLMPALLFLSIATLCLGAWLRRPWLTVGGPLLCCAFVLLTRPATMMTGDSRGYTRCRHNLKQIALAMHLYHEEHGCYPPAYVADDEGRPMHSWRVLLLPYLENEDFSDRYDFGEPWNSRHNQAATRVPMRLYQCPSADRRPGLTTNYVVVTGEETVFPGEKPRGLHDIPDGASNTILVVEIADSDIHWAEPYDLSLSELLLQINADSEGGISSGHRGGAMVALADGSVRFLREGIDPLELRALLTADGGEPVDLDGW